MVDLLSGALSSILINTVLPSLEFSEIMIVILNFAGLVSMLALFEKMEYWSFLYTFGYFMGILLLGCFLMEGLELTLYFVVLLSYILVKGEKLLLKKLRDYLQVDAFTSSNIAPPFSVRLQASRYV